MSDGRPDGKGERAWVGIGEPRRHLSWAQKRLLELGFSLTIYPDATADVVWPEEVPLGQ